MNTQTINQSLDIIESGLNYINNELTNSIGYHTASHQEQVIKNSLMTGIQQAHLNALELKTTYIQYHRFISSIIACSATHTPNCESLIQQLGLLDPTADYLRRQTYNFKININWFPSAV